MSTSRVVGGLLWNAKRRAERRGLPFAITADDIEVPAFCPALGIPLFKASGQKAQGPNSPTLDRIDPDLGYVPGNVRVISSRANQIKSDATPAELLQVACWIQENS